MRTEDFQNCLTSKSVRSTVLWNKFEKHCSLEQVWKALFFGTSLRNTSLEQRSNFCFGKA